MFSVYELEAQAAKEAKCSGKATTFLSALYAVWIALKGRSSSHAHHIRRKNVEVSCVLSLKAKLSFVVSRGGLKKRA